MIASANTVPSIAATPIVAPPHQAAVPEREARQRARVDVAAAAWVARPPQGRARSWRLLQRRVPSRLRPGRPEPDGQARSRRGIVPHTTAHGVEDRPDEHHRRRRWPPAAARRSGSAWRSGGPGFASSAAGDEHLGRVDSTIRARSPAMPLRRPQRLARRDDRAARRKLPGAGGDGVAHSSVSAAHGSVRPPRPAAAACARR